jgi:hypothetical protein
MRKIILLLLVYSQITFSGAAVNVSGKAAGITLKTAGEVTKPTVTASSEAVTIFFKDLKSDVDLIESGITIVKVTAGIAGAIFSYCCPDEEKKLKDAQAHAAQGRIRVLEAKESLRQCIVKHAFESRENSQFPSECKDLAELFAILAGVEKRNEFLLEFNQAISELPCSEKKEESTGPSIIKITIIGGSIVIVGGVVLFFASPIIFPGTIIAAKATTATVAIKSGAAAVITKVAALVAQTPELAVQAPGMAMGLYVQAKDGFDKLSFADKVGVITQGIDIAKVGLVVSQYAYSCATENSEQKLQRLERQEEASPGLKDLLTKKK